MNKVKINSSNKRVSREKGVENDCLSVSKLVFSGG